jgi:type IV pilus assembly protein PilQ
MSNMKEKRPLHVLGYMLIVILFFIIGCAANDNNTKKTDPFFDKWSGMAETDKGSSPAEKEKEIKLPTQAEVDAIIKEGEQQDKALPKTKITMKLRQADVKSVLRSLARISGQNLLVKNEVKGDISVDFQNVPWDEAFLSILKDQGLTYVWEGNILRVMTLADLDQDFKRKSQQLGTKLVEPLVTVVVKIDYADATKLKENVQEFLTKDKDGKARGSVKIDEHNNALIIQAIRDDLKRMIPIIEKIDKPTKQIYIKANIVETTKETARDLGIQWGGLYHDGNVTITPGGKGTSATSDVIYNPVFGDTGIGKQGWSVNFPVDAAKMAAAGGSGSIGLIVGAGGYILEAQLTALQKDGKLNILSSPSITTLDNQKAFTENGQKVPYVTLSNEGDQEVKFEDAVLRLEITPHVIDDNTLKLKIFVKKDEVDPIKNVRGNPYIIKKQTETNLIVKNGETVVISGLTKQTTNDGDTGVPWLKDIPGLGHLFKKTSVGDTKEEVLIFITPQILKTELSKAEVPLNAEKQP